MTMVNKLLLWIKTYWPRLPRDIRMALLMAFVSVATAFVVLAWKDGYRPVGMGKLLTRETSQHQLDTLKQHLEAGRSQAITEALVRYDSAMHAYLSTERELGMDTLVRPTIKMLFDLDTRLRGIERAMKRTNEKVDQMPNAYEERLRKLIEDNNAQDRNARMLEQVIRRLDAQDSANAALQRAIEEIPFRRTTKQRF